MLAFFIYPIGASAVAPHTLFAHAVFPAGDKACSVAAEETENGDRMYSIFRNAFLRGIKTESVLKVVRTFFSLVHFRHGGQEVGL